MSLPTPPILQTLHLSPPQQTAALAANADVVVTAGAGTGKTRTLVARFLALLASGVPLRHIVAITFTRKAAQEMRNRLRREIGSYLQTTAPESAEQALWRSHYHEIDAARINTIHNLCGEILRAHPAEAQVDPRFAVLDENQAAQLRQETSEAVLAWAAETAVVIPLFSLLPERALHQLILYLLQNRLALQTAMAQVPATAVPQRWQTLLEAAQQEAISQMRALPEWSLLRRNQATSSADKLEIQRQLMLTAVDTPSDAPLAEQLRNMAILDEISLRAGSKKSWPGGTEQLETVKAALKAIHTAYKAQLALTLRPNAQDAALTAVLPALHHLFEQTQRLYDERKTDRNAVDFDDLEQMAVALLEADADLRHRWQGQVTALLVDEFQDTNERQRRLIRLLCPEPGKLFIVGDAKQSIYRFRGADVAVFAAEKQRIEQANGRVLELATSYRAHDALLASMNWLLRPVLGDDSPERPLWRAPFARLQPGGKRRQPGLAEPFVEFHLAVGSKADVMPVAARAVAARLHQLHKTCGIDFGQMAILCRASGAFAHYENGLDEAGIPYVTVAGKGFFERPEVRDLLNMLRVIADPHDDLALIGLLRSPVCGVSDVALFQLMQTRPSAQSLWQGLQTAVDGADGTSGNQLATAVARIRALHRQAGRIPVADILKQWLDSTFYRAMLRHVGDLRALRNVDKLLADIHQSQLVDIGEFLAYAQTLRDSGSRQGEARALAGGGVQIMSIHAAKGLEFPVVVLGDAGYENHPHERFLFTNEAGLVLSLKSEADEVPAIYKLVKAQIAQQEAAEADRLLYVALTRAEQLLLVNGTVTLTNEQALSSKGWLKQLAQITGASELVFDVYEEEGSAVHRQPVADGVAMMALYEPNWQAAETFVPTPQPASTTAVARPLAKAMQEPVVTPTLPPKDEPITPQRVWQVVPTAYRSTAPAWLIGTLVHEALALWRFPTAPSFAAWVTARAREYGLTDGQQLQHAEKETRRLLNRFRQLPIFAEIDAAEQRWHELPYSYTHHGRVENGFIDLLYRRNGAWRLVDFKTDYLQNEAELDNLLAEGDYLGQVRQYATAVEALLGVQPEAYLCFLNLKAAPRLVSVGKQPTR